MPSNDLKTILLTLCFVVGSFLISCFRQFALQKITCFSCDWWLGWNANIVAECTVRPFLSSVIRLDNYLEPWFFHWAVSMLFSSRKHESFLVRCRPNTRPHFPSTLSPYQLVTSWHGCIIITMRCICTPSWSTHLWVRSNLPEVQILSELCYNVLPPGETRFFEWGAHCFSLIYCSC